MPETNGSTKIDTENPFAQRICTVKPGDVVIFRFPEGTTPEDAEAASAHLETKMGAVPFVVVGPEVDLAVLRAAVTPKVFIR